MSHPHLTSQTSTSRCNVSGRNTKACTSIPHSAAHGTQLGWRTNLQTCTRSYHCQKTSLLRLNLMTFPCCLLRISQLSLAHQDRNNQQIAPAPQRARLLLSHQKPHQPSSNPPTTRRHPAQHVQPHPKHHHWAIPTMVVIHLLGPLHPRRGTLALHHQGTFQQFLVVRGSTATLRAKAQDGKQSKTRLRKDLSTCSSNSDA